MLSTYLREPSITCLWYCRVRSLHSLTTLTSTCTSTHSFIRTTLSHWIIKQKKSNRSCCKSQSPTKPSRTWLKRSSRRDYLCIFKVAVTSIIRLKRPMKKNLMIGSALARQQPLRLAKRSWSLTMGLTTRELTTLIHTRTIRTSLSFSLCVSFLLIWLGLTRKLWTLASSQGPNIKWEDQKLCRQILGSKPQANSFWARLRNSQVNVFFQSWTSSLPSKQKTQLAMWTTRARVTFWHASTLSVKKD